MAVKSCHVISPALIYRDRSKCFRAGEACSNLKSQKMWCYITGDTCRQQFHKLMLQLLKPLDTSCISKNNWMRILCRCHWKSAVLTPRVMKQAFTDASALQMKCDLSLTGRPAHNAHENIMNTVWNYCSSQSSPSLFTQALWPMKTM